MSNNNNPERSVFDRLDSIEDKTDNLVGLLTSINQSDLNSQKDLQEQLIAQKEEIEKQRIEIENLKKNHENVSNKSELKNNIQMIKEFVKKSKKEYLWFGPPKEFSKSKVIVCIACCLSFLIGIISTILTCKAAQYYTTFSFFENIYLVFYIIIVVKVNNCTLRIKDEDLKMNCTDSSFKNADGLIVFDDEKGVYKIFKIIAIVCACLNICYVLFINPNPGKVVATIFELLFIITIIGVRHASVAFYCMYDTVIFTGMNFSNTKKVSIVKTKMEKNFVEYEAYMEKYGQFYRN